MVISVLLDIDNLGENITAALRSNSDIGNVSSVSSPSLRLLKGRSYLHLMTNIDPSRHPDIWDVPVRPCIIKPWLNEIPSNGYHTLPDTTTTPTDSLGPLPDLVHRSPVTADIAKLELLPELSSPYQSCDEDWRTYLTDASFSNTMDPLQLHEDGSPLSFVYPLDEADVVDGCGHFLSEQLLFSTIPNFPTQSPTRLSDSFVENAASPLSTGSHPSRAISLPDHGFAVDLQEGTTNETACIPNGTYASLMELNPPALDFGSARFSSLETPSRLRAESVHLATPGPLPHRRGRSPTVCRKGLSGWADSQHLRVPEPSVIGARMKRIRSPSKPPCSSPRRPYALSPLASNQEVEETSSTHDNKRSKTSEGSSLSLGSVKGIEVVDPDSETDRWHEAVPEDDSDSDDYRPSRSSSGDPGVASSFLQALPEVLPDPSKQKSTRRGKGKAKGSAALALAVVTQLGAAKRRSASEHYDGDDFGPVTLYREGRHGIRKKNQIIPFPIAIPNLNKKSRGRKVPYVVGVKTSGGSPQPAEASTEDQGSASSVVADTKTKSSGVGRSRRKTARVPTVVASVDLAGDRAYVCAVPGCGKCFVRGEHLKRHVRSIHTHDKPHPCPFEGCDKSFSRRDNLGQHVRIHLQP